MTKKWAVLGLFALVAGVVAACVIDIPDVVDASSDSGAEGGLADAVKDVSYDVADMGVGVTDSGLPCVCVGSLPPGYSVIEYVPSARPGCSAGYDGSTDTIENPTAGASTCTCNCNSVPLVQPTCDGGTETFDISSGNGNCTDVKGESLVASATCTSAPQSLNPGGNELNNMLVAPPDACAPTGGLCGGATKTTTFPAPSASQGRTCRIDTPPGQAACASSDLCVATAGAPFATCITNFALVSCTDPDFPVSHVVGTAPIVDSRSCGPSACACDLLDAGTCGDWQLTLYTFPGCFAGTTLPADNKTCTAVGFGNGASFQATSYSASAEGGVCGVPGVYGPLGGLGVTSPFTLCCRP